MNDSITVPVQEIQTVTATELYKLSDLPELLCKKPMDADGNYFILWMVEEKKYHTKHNFLNQF